MKKRLLLTLLFFISLAFVSTKFAAVGFIKDSSKPETDQPVFFQINPVFWLPAYLKYGTVISDSQILPSLGLTIPYWLIISFIISSLLFITPFHPPLWLKRGKPEGRESSHPES